MDQTSTGLCLFLDCGAITPLFFLCLRQKRRKRQNKSGVKSPQSKKSKALPQRSTPNAPHAWRSAPDALTILPQSASGPNKEHYAKLCVHRSIFILA
jgi:hypothetical protein